MKFHHFFYLFPAFIGNLCLASLSYTFSVHPEGAGIISYDSYENCLDVVGNECELVEELVAYANDGYRFSHFLIDEVEIYGEPPLNNIYAFPIGEFNSVNGIYDEGEEFIDALNGVYDEGEVWEDVANGVYDEGEDFVDALNGIYDIGEAFTDQGSQLEPIVIDYNGVEGTEDIGLLSEYNGVKYYGYSKNVLAGEAVTFSINVSSVVGSPEMLIQMFDPSGVYWWAQSDTTAIGGGLNTIEWGTFEAEVQLRFLVAVGPSGSVTLDSFSISDQSGSSIFQATSYISPNGVYDEGEPFVDALNGVYDEGESFTDAGNGIYDEGEPFVDALNGVYDEGEEFTDSFINYYNPTLDHNIEAHFVPDNVIFVDKDAPENGDGMTWYTAFKYLNDAISFSSNNSGTYQIWVAEGTYYTDEGALYSNDDQNSVFNIPSNVESLIGGFSGNEQSKDEANPKQYLTKLSGLIFEEYGATGIGSSHLFTAAGGNYLSVSGFSFNNSSDQDGCVLNLSSSNNITFEFCNFSDNQSTENLIQANQNTVFRNCSFERNQSSSSYLINGGSFESSFFNENVTYDHLIVTPKKLDRVFIINNISKNNSIVLRPESVYNSVFIKNRAYDYIIDTSHYPQPQILHSTFVDNYNYRYNYPEIGGGLFTVGNCLFFRSAFNRGNILESVTVGYKSSVNLPVESAFFGILDYYNGEYGSDSINGLFPNLTGLVYQDAFTGSSVFESTFFNTFKAGLPSVLSGIKSYSGQGEYNILLSNSRQLFGQELCNINDSYNPEFTKEFDIEYPDPFVNSSDPLGPDGEPFTEDDGLRLDPNSEWASEVINVPTINADYELTDILGNDRIIGDLIDLGAYEYMPLEDADGDGISDSNDAFPNNANETLDTDGDGLGDNEDSDDDGDGVDDSVEIATGTNPKQYNSALHSFVQTLGGGAFDADDIAESRLAGQSDVTSDPNAFNLFTQAELTSATETGHTQGQNAVTSDPNSFGLFSSNDISTAQSEFRILGQQDVVSDPLSYGLYSPSYTIGLIDASREAGREDVTSDPSAYGLQATSGSGSNTNSSNVPTSLAGLIEVVKPDSVDEDINGNGILDSGEDTNGNGILDYGNSSDFFSCYYTSETLFSERTMNTSFSQDEGDQNLYSWDPENKLLQGIEANGDVLWSWVYEFIDSQTPGIYTYKYKAYNSNVIITEGVIPDETGYGFFYSADGDLDENGISDKTEFYYDDAFFGNELRLGNFFGDETSIISNNFPNSLPEIQSSVSNDSSSATLYSLEEIKDLRPGSTMIEIHDGKAILTMEVEQSDDLGIWTNGGASTLQIPIDAEAGKKFFRFKMTE